MRERGLDFGSSQVQQPQPTLLAPTAFVGPDETVRERVTERERGLERDCVGYWVGSMKGREGATERERAAGFVGWVRVNVGF